MFAQGLKLLIYLLEEKRVNIAKLIDSGGMPSSHTALASSLCVALGLIEGWSSSLFAISAVVWAVIVYDATGIRRSAGKHAAALNDIIAQLMAGKFLKAGERIGTNYRELLGHDPLEVFVGAIVGIVVTVLFLYGYSII